jgi:hypothetical protein
MLKVIIIINYSFRNKLSIRKEKKLEHRKLKLLLIYSTLYMKSKERCKNYSKNLKK